ncbi:hypothetical protein MRB53_040733 [Persea americana]|nr:hypothetical protein MRB53_040733 [Persea americana]
MVQSHNNLFRIQDLRRSYAHEFCGDGPRVVVCHALLRCKCHIVAGFDKLALRKALSATSEKAKLSSASQSLTVQSCIYSITVGVGITEISHRSADANAILANAKSGLCQLLDIPESTGPEGYEILFLQGGGSGEFSAVVYNLISVWVGEQVKALGVDGSSAEGLQQLQRHVQQELKMDYLVTGSWSLKASQEAARLAGAQHVNIVTDSRKHRDGKFGVIAESSTWTPTLGSHKPAFTYYCDNETVDGVEFRSSPDGHNLVADMSSNFLSRPVDVRKHAVIFGGAQKNIGTTGITIAIVSNRLLPPHASLASPELLREVMQRLLAKHLASAGARIAGQHAESNYKAFLLYSALDKSSVYHVVPDKSVRSRMNICFRVKGGDESAEKEFLKGAESLGLTGLKGHRSVGGIRASSYNAVPIMAVEKLVLYLEDFASRST